MRVDADCRDPELLAAEVRRLQAVIASGEPSVTRPTLTDAEREAIRTAIAAFAENNDDAECARIESTLNSLLERLG